MNIFLISDTHFGHQNSCNWLTDDGEKYRPWGTSEEMDEEMVKRWNSVVAPKDKVYHLGDVAMKRKDIATIGRCNGEKILIRGNHDIFNLEDYTPYFKDIRGTHKLDNFLISHIPIHPESIARWAGGNIHGHTHRHRVNLFDGPEDPRYICVSVEQINYTPIPLETIKQRIA
jgi:calcineurin-like phosphoesterase family protein